MKYAVKSLMHLFAKAQCYGQFGELSSKNQKFIDHTKKFPRRSVNSAIDHYLSIVSIQRNVCCERKKVSNKRSWCNGQNTCFDV